jgi:uncharacterized protein
MLPADKVNSEMAYLQIAIDKTAGAAEQEAWGWLQAAVAQHQQSSQTHPSAQTTQATQATPSNQGAR